MTILKCMSAKTLSESTSKSKICPRCKRAYKEYPALSRLDNKTEICPECGVIEAMEDFYEGKVSNWMEGESTIES